MKFSLSSFSFLFLTFTLVLSSLTLISAQPPFQEENTFMTIDYTKVDVYKTGEDILFNFFVTDSSTGLKLTNATTSCRFNLFYGQGFQILVNDSSAYHIEGEDFENNILGGNFSSPGEYAFHTYCTNGTIGGSLSSVKGKEEKEEIFWEKLNG